MARWAVTSPALLLALTGLALLAWTAAGGRRRRRPAVVLVSVLLSLLAAGDGADAYYGYLPRLGDVGGVTGTRDTWDVLAATDVHDPAAAARHPRGGVLTLAVPDDGRGLGPTSALVWLPPQYLASTGERFPVVYLFHGSPGVPADWLRGGEAADTGLALARRGRPAILVVPRMSRGWLDDPECVDGVQEQVESHFWSDVVPTVDAQLRTLASRDGRALAGMSAGGYCALHLGLEHRNEVATVLDLSGLTAPTHRGGVEALYGPDAAPRAAVDTPSAYAPHLSAGPVTRVWLDTGAHDGDVRPGMERLARILAARGLQVRLRVRPGAHTFRVWRPALAEALAWALPGMAAPA